MSPGEKNSFFCNRSNDETSVKVSFSSSEVFDCVGRLVLYISLSFLLSNFIHFFVETQVNRRFSSTMNRTTTTESHHIARRSSATPIHSKPSFNASHPRSKMNDESTASSSVCVTFTKDQKEQLTPYERLLYEAEYDPRVYAEEKAGRRIGFYRLKGNIGLGNFSKVKLGVHLLARGKTMIISLLFTFSNAEHLRSRH